MGGIAISPLEKGSRSFSFAIINLKTTMISQLSSANKVTLIAIAAISIAKVKFPTFSPNLKRLSAINTWEVPEILGGDRIIVSSRSRTLTVHLCSIAGDYFDKSDESKRYLKSLIERGELRINFLNEDDEIFFADVFVRLKPDYQQEIYLNKEMVDAGMATVDSSHLCPYTIFDKRNNKI